MTTKVVIRLLDAAGSLLGWAECQAKAKGDGKLWPSAPVVVRLEAFGHPTAVSLHWCDVNVEVRLPLPPGPTFAVGHLLTVFDGTAPLFTVGPMPGPLPPVTGRHHTAIGVPAAQLGVGR